VLRRLLTEHDTGHANHGEDLWDLLVLELWQRTFVDSAGTPPDIVTATASGR
jgi:hypothetical protein